jgi:2,4-dienoyl-CoA reductase-like NADH-dependent reductase (Old Yellow Enzyme family)
MQNDTLFRPFSLKSLHTRNRFVMAPMTRASSPDGIPTGALAAYYKRRAEGEVGFIITEGTVIERPSAASDPNVPVFYGEQALEGWQQLIAGVQHAGAAIAPQLWHAGIQEGHGSGWRPPVPFEGPSTTKNGHAMSDSDIADTLSAFGRAAADARRLGCSAVEIQGAHGYLIDQFFRDDTNTRHDRFGGQSLGERSRFAAAVIKEIRRQTGDDFTLIIRLSQWRFSDYNCKLAKTPQEMETWLTPLADAGIDIFHCSTRRFWEPEFDGSTLNMAGWAKKLTGKATITVGSVGLDKDITTLYKGENSSPASIEELVRRMENNEFDLVAVGRSILTDPHWVQKIRENRLQELQGFDKAALAHLT